MRLQLVGMPLHAHRRLKSDIEQWADSIRTRHHLRMTPSQEQRTPQISESVVNDVRRSVEEGFVHIFVVPTRGWKFLADEFRFDCRVAVMQEPNDILRASWDDLRQALEAALTFEEQWLRVVCPADLRHVLLLPPPSFEPEREIQEYWSRCDVYRDASLIREAHDLLTAVRACHERRHEGGGHCHVDCRGRVFRPDRTRHAMTAAERQGQKRFRFCMEIPVGFHYDVTHARGGDVRVRDYKGMWYQAVHANIDPWGHIRAIAN